MKIVKNKDFERDKSETEIFLEGRHFRSYSESKNEEPFFVIINKEDLSMTGKSLSYKTETHTFNSQCSLRMDDIKK